VQTCSIICGPRLFAFEMLHNASTVVFVVCYPPEASDGCALMAICLKERKNNLCSGERIKIITGTLILIIL